MSYVQPKAIARLGRSLGLAYLVVSSACQRGSDPQASASAAPIPARPSSVAANVPSAPTTPSASSPPSTSAPSSALVSSLAPTAALERLPGVASPLTAACTDPRAVLSMRKEFDRSARLFVQQVLLAYPELQLVPEKATNPREIDVYETIYGPARFARLYPRDPLFNEAVIARCGDAATCNQVAALFTALQPKAKVTLSCGVPPATTGGFARVAELAPKRLVPADASAPRVAICARIAACSLREGAAVADAATCERSSIKLGGCSAAATCTEVVRCAAETR